MPRADGGRRGWAAPLLALGFGSALAAGAVAAFEWSLRAEEVGTLVFVADPPALKYAYAPTDTPRKRGWEPTRPALPRSPGTKRVVYVGDSVTFGDNVGPKEPWPVVVTDWLDRQARATDTGRVEGFNFATTGYDIGQVVAVVTHGVEAWAPDLVVYGSYTNDVSPTRLLYRRQEPDPIFVSREVPAPVALIGPAADAWLVVRSAAWRRLLGARYARFLDENPGGSDDIESYRAGLAALRRWSQETGTPLVVVGLAPHVLANPARCPELLLEASDRCALNQQRHAQTTAALQDAGLPWTDTLPALQATGEDAFYPDNRNDPDHPSPAGHRVYAKAALPLLQGALGLPRAGADPSTLPPPPRQKKSSRDFPRPDRP